MLRLFTKPPIRQFHVTRRMSRHCILTLSARLFRTVRTDSHDPRRLIETQACCYFAFAAPATMGAGAGAAGAASGAAPAGVATTFVAAESTHPRGAFTQSVAAAGQGRAFASAGAVFALAEGVALTSTTGTFPKTRSSV